MIGIDGGISTNSIPKDRPANNFANGGQTVMTLGSSFDIKAAIEMPKHLEVGIGINWASIWFRNRWVFNDTNFGRITKNDLTTNYVISYGAIPVYFFINKKVPMIRGFFYYGLSAGYVHSSAGASGLQRAGYATATDVKLYYRQAYNDADGFYTAVTAGYALKLRKQLYIDMEGSVKYFSMKSNNPSTINVLCFPLTLGLQYRK